MSDTLQRLFDQSSVPAPRANLSEDIIRAAVNAPGEVSFLADHQALQLANDNRRRFWAASAAIAATMAAGLFIWNSQLVDGENLEAEQWEQYADLTGFADLHDWVEGTDP